MVSLQCKRFRVLLQVWVKMFLLKYRYIIFPLKNVYFICVQLNIVNVYVTQILNNLFISKFSFSFGVSISYFQVFSAGVKISSLILCVLFNMCLSSQDLLIFCYFCSNDIVKLPGL